MDVLEIVAKHPFWFAAGAIGGILSWVLARVAHAVLIGNSIAYGIATDGDYFRPPDEGEELVLYWTKKRGWRPASLLFQRGRLLFVRTINGPRVVRLRSGGRNVRALEL